MKKAEPNRSSRLPLVPHFRDSTWKPELSLSLLVRFRLLVDGVPFAVFADEKGTGTLVSTWILLVLAKSRRSS